MNNKPHTRLTDEVIPSHATHPSEVLLDELVARELTPQQLAKEMNIPLITLNNILHRKKPITPEIAYKLGKTLDIDAKFWLRFQMKYEWDILRIKHREEIKKAKSLNNNQKKELLAQVFYQMSL